jgi:hypothetical protein|tara:strand:- start:419 stop:1084 length:666 start_codon:yes stop_codon:yes gene_type:complete
MLLINGGTTPHSIADKDNENKWYRLTFELGMRGLSPIPSAVEGIRMTDSMANVTTEFYRLIKIHFKELYIFDMELVTGLPVEEKVEEYVVYDWFNVKRGAKQPACKILTSTDFVKELVFYPSIRKDGNDGSFKDCYTKSYISAHQMNEFEYSETAAKMITMRLIKQNGLQGPSRSFGEREHSLNLILEHDRREEHKNQKIFIGAEELPDNIYLCNITGEWN